MPANYVSLNRYSHKESEWRKMAKMGLEIQWVNWKNNIMEAMSSINPDDENCHDRRRYTIAYGEEKVRVCRNPLNNNDLWNYMWYATLITAEEYNETIKFCKNSDFYTYTKAYEKLHTSLKSTEIHNCCISCCESNKGRRRREGSKDSMLTKPS